MTGQFTVLEEIQQAVPAERPEIRENRGDNSFMSVIETMIDIPAEHEKNVCGQFDVYLKKIERTLHVTILARDGQIKLIGPERAVGQAKSVFNNLAELSRRGNTITEQNVDYALSLSFTEDDGQILELTGTLSAAPFPASR